MNMELSAEQAEQVMQLSDLLNIYDFELITSVLRQNKWDSEVAYSFITNGHSIENKFVTNEPSTDVFGPNEWIQEINARYMPAENSQPSEAKHKEIIKEQDLQYKRSELAQKSKQEKQKNMKQQMQEKEKKMKMDKDLFAQHKAVHPIEVKFRLPLKVAQKTFDLKDSIEMLYQYVNGCLRDGFEQRYSAFQLIQVPSTNLKTKMRESLHECFGESIGEVIIVKQLN